MNREIKFRAWDGSKMLYSEKGDFYLMTYGLCDVPSSTGHDFTSHAYPLMQYTGLKDKNGVEIYEGDVVKMNRNPKSKRGQSFEHTGVAIITPEVGVVFEGNSNKNGDWMPYDVPEYEYEIIGDIYRNPELIK